MMPIFSRCLGIGWLIFFLTPPGYAKTTTAVPEKAEPQLVCFSPEQACDEKLIAFLKSAHTSIDIAIFDLTHPGIAQALIEKAKTVKVRVVADNRQAKGPLSQVSKFIGTQVLVKLGKQRGIMHHKFAVLDSLKLQTGSYNYTIKASMANRENQIYLTDAEVVKKYQEHFESIWKTGSDYQPPQKEGKPKPS
jgi:phosphatidylserine/phosphatidylglycerophosphate/cardiolipin synthase-like enzyme